MSDVTERLRNIAGHMLNAADRYEAADEIDRWRGAASGDQNVQTDIIVGLNEDLLKLKEENVALRDALQFYAARENWVDQQVDYGGNYTDVAMSARAMDGGRTARVTLAAIDGN